MRTTLNIDDSVYREIKIRAAREGRTVTEIVEFALRNLLSGEITGRGRGVRDQAQPPHNRFPTIQTTRRPVDGQPTPDVGELNRRIQQAELDADLERNENAFRH